MKIKQVCNYQLYDAHKAVLVFYGVVCSIVIFSSILFAIDANSGSTGGMETATIVFLFIAGLNSFKGPFRFLLANGVSRKSQFWGFVASVPVMAGAMAVIDALLNLLFSLFIDYESLFYQLYSRRYNLPMGGTWVVFVLEKLLWSLFAYSAVMMLGFLITLLYYRMSKLPKILVSVFVPVTLVVILPYIDFRFTSGKIFKMIFDFIVAAFGLAGTVNPYIPMFTCTASFAIMALLSWLLMRRAVVTD